MEFVRNVTKQKVRSVFPKLEYRWNQEGILEQKVTIIQHIKTEDKNVGITTEWWEVKADGKSVSSLKNK